MEIIYADSELGPKYEKCLKNDMDPEAIFGLSLNYQVDRGIAEMLGQAYIRFNFFRYLEDVYHELGRPLEVLEGGCGYGYALRDLKAGVTGLEQFSRMPYKELKWRESNSLECPVWYFEKFTGDSFPGLGTKIRTTGVSLCREHPEVAERVKEQDRIDEFIVGPIGQYPFRRRYDAILDPFGAAYYFPDEAIQVYGRNLEPNGIVYMKLFNCNQEKGEREVEALMRSNHLEVVAKVGNGMQIDVICRGTGFPLLCRAPYSEIKAVINRTKYTSPYYTFRETTI